jgi:hypothetical protein
MGHLDKKYTIHILLSHNKMDYETQVKTKYADKAKEYVEEALENMLIPKKYQVGLDLLEDVGAKFFGNQMTRTLLELEKSTRLNHYHIYISNSEDWSRVIKSDVFKSTYSNTYATKDWMNLYTEIVDGDQYISIWTGRYPGFEYIDRALLVDTKGELEWDCNRDEAIALLEPISNYRAFNQHLIMLEKKTRSMRCIYDMTKPFYYTSNITPEKLLKDDFDQISFVLKDPRTDKTIDVLVQVLFGDDDRSQFILKGGYVPYPKGLGVNGTIDNDLYERLNSVERDAHNNGDYRYTHRYPGFMTQLYIKSNKYAPLPKQQPTSGYLVQAQEFEDGFIFFETYKFTKNGMKLYKTIISE